MKVRLISLKDPSVGRFFRLPFMHHRLFLTRQDFHFNVLCVCVERMLLSKHNRTHRDRVYVEWLMGMAHTGTTVTCMSIERYHQQTSTGGCDDFANIGFIVIFVGTSQLTN